MRRFATLLVLLFGLAAVSTAQTPTPLRVLVVDPTGAPLPDAEVTIESQGKVLARSKTNRAGEFTFSAPQATYQVTVLEKGFNSYWKQDVAFSSGVPARIVLAPGTFSGVDVDTSRTPPVELQSVPPSTATIPEPPTSILASRPWDLGVFTQGGVGLTEDRNGFRFFMAGLHAGKVLTAPAGPGVLRGQFEYAVELFPFWQSYTPTFYREQCVAAPASPTGISCSAPYKAGGTYSGASFTPDVLRWNFTGTRRLTPWVQGAGGLLWTNHKYPAYGGAPYTLQNDGPSAETSVWNFTPQFGIGVHWFVRPKNSIDFGANAIHISSASLGDRNPGVNASVQFTAGYSWWK